MQSSFKTKGFINKYFNIGSYIVTIWGTNMNLGILQCKNCWKWGYMTFVYHAHGFKYIKCNGSHKVEYHRDIA